LSREISEILRGIQNKDRHGFGCAIQKGFAVMQRDAVVIMMANESDDSRDVVRYWNVLNQGYDCVFGSRFMRSGGVIDYPFFKHVLNRLAKQFIRILFAFDLMTLPTHLRPIGKVLFRGVGRCFFLILI
jgi:dolichol-phosphate mannosyltransferase